jgi:hypothetical protein
VIATIILSAVVIAVGGGVWSYSQGAATAIANDYINGTMTLMNEVIERFIVEHVSNNSDGSRLYVWVSNNGDVDITVDVYVNATHIGTPTTYTFRYNLTHVIVSCGIEKIEVHFDSPNDLDYGDEVAVKVHSRRQKNAYYTWTVQ